MKIETKYNLGDIVWYIKDDKVKCNKINGIEIGKALDVQPKASILSEYIKYIGAGNFTKHEFEVFPTKESLLKSL